VSEEASAHADSNVGPCGAPWSWHQEHERYINVDSYDVAYEVCHFPNGTMYGQLVVIGKVTPTRAAAIRRAVAAFRAGRGTKPGPPR
jgi:hypothetical protein